VIAAALALKALGDVPTYRSAERGKPAGFVARTLRDLARIDAIDPGVEGEWSY
jgi:hypothetical protein